MEPERQNPPSTPAYLCAALGPLEPISPPHDGCASLDYPDAVRGGIKAKHKGSHYARQPRPHPSSECRSRSNRPQPLDTLQENAGRYVPEEHPAKRALCGMAGVGHQGVDAQSDVLFGRGPSIGRPVLPRVWIRRSFRRRLRSLARVKETPKLQREGWIMLNRVP